MKPANYSKLISNIQYHEDCLVRLRAERTAFWAQVNEHPACEPLSELLSILECNEKLVRECRADLLRMEESECPPGGQAV